MSRQILLHSRGEHYATVDDDIFPYIHHLRWYRKSPLSYTNKAFAYRLTTKYPEPARTISLHQEVIRFHGLSWFRITHCNGDGLDNRLENLAPQFCIIELERRAQAIRDYQKIKAIRDQCWRNDKS